MSKILPILNQFKDLLDKLIKSANNSFNTETLAKSAEIHLSNNDIPGPGKKKKGLNRETEFLK